MPNFNTPRRFQIKPASTRPVALEAQPPSGTNEQLGSVNPPPTKSHTHGRSAFAATPRFSHRPAVAASQRRPAEEDTAERYDETNKSPTLAQLQRETPVSTRARGLHRVETINDSQEAVIEHDAEVGAVERDGWEEVDQRLGHESALKRRHSDAQDDNDDDEEILLDTRDDLVNTVATTDSQVTHDSIESVLQASPTAHRRFILHSPRSSTTRIPAPPRFQPTSNAPASTQSPAPRRPIFILPPQQSSPNGAAPSPEQLGSTPLPDVFSPHRRGQKYVAGGLADEVRKWIVDVAHTAPAYTSSRRDSRGFSTTQVPTSSLLSTQKTTRGVSRGDWDRARRSLVLKITAVQGDAMARSGSAILVEGIQVATQAGDESTLRLMLIAKGGRKSLDTRRESGRETLDLAVGRHVEARAPVWPVEMLGNTWLVVVDWRVA